ncbi:9440_t:CDS:1, partial [Diversispora eburnea]
MEKWMANSNEETTETPSEWKKEYKPKQEIQNTIFQTVIQEISIEELENILKESAKNKAPGPTGITYEIWKKMGLLGKGILRKLLNEMITSTSIDICFPLM